MSRPGCDRAKQGKVDNYGYPPVLWDWLRLSTHIQQWRPSGKGRALENVQAV